MVSSADLVGNRDNVVMINGADHVPPPYEAVTDCMEALFDLMAAETSDAVNAVLGHFFIGFIHPYTDGNGRLARFLMNIAVAEGGYPWTIIHVQNRAEYMKSLDEAA